MMRSDPVDRWTLQDTWEFPVLQRILAMTSGKQSARVSMESAARSSLDEWEGWHRERGQYHLGTSPELTNVQLPVVQVWREVRPALAQEPADFVEDVLHCWQPGFL